MSVWRDLSELLGSAQLSWARLGSAGLGSALFDMVLFHTDQALHAMQIIDYYVILYRC